MKIDFEPLGKRIEIADSYTILDAARQVGMEMAAVCGGGGTCGACRIRLASGKLSPITENEKKKLSNSALQTGYRLACQSRPLSDCCIEILPASLTATQRIQVDGLHIPYEFDPSIVLIHTAIPAPHNKDFQADDQRINQSLEKSGFPVPVSMSLPVLNDLSTELRAQNWDVKLAISADSPRRLISCQSRNSRSLGIACDMGSTKLALYLSDLESGEIIAKSGNMNPQISYGEDVVNRIAYSNKHDEGRHTLQHRLVSTINEMIVDLCRQTNTKPEWIVDCVMVGNTAMHHFFAGFPVKQLGEAPYIPAVSQAVHLNAADVGLHTASGAEVFMPPNIAGFVGADHVSMMLAADTWHGDQTCLSMDIGTNTEISLFRKGNLFSCSCASGPAFEGAHIQSGMRAAAGAIERIRIVNEKVIWQTIDGKPAIGICGSGILDAVAEMKMAGIIDERGAFSKGKPLGEHKNQMVIVTSSQSGLGKDIVVTRSDINQIQLAKAAIQAGVEVLLIEAGISAVSIDSFVIAGAFGTYLDVDHCIEIGLLPDLSIEKFHQIGNAAGMGACQMLLSRKRRKDAELIARASNYIELTIHPEFTRCFLNAMYLGRGYSNK